MKERVIYNTYYEEFETFKLAVFGFFDVLSNISAESTVGKNLRSRIKAIFLMLFLE